MNAYTWSELKKLHDDKLVKEHDWRAEHTVVGIDYFLEEMRHRNHARHAEAMGAYTQRITRMTVIITVASVVMAVGAIVNAAVTFWR